MAKQKPPGKPPSQRKPSQANGSGPQTTENIFNPFLFVEGELITKLGGLCHEKGGTVREKIAFLQANLTRDLLNATEFPIPESYTLVTPSGTETGLRYEGYLKLSELGRHLKVFEEVFEHFDGSEDPLSCITPIVDGKPKIEIIAKF
ncbi:hypothetical protein V5E97_05265 [Singulisphaera sp. Ch08]|uniref:Uncharacterized protein n=1 Tax=Singulisphaera sp. Ch08 TaxID=3120278 RepID=A0AAU7CJI4_9BACT